MLTRVDPDDPAQPRRPSRAEIEEYREEERRTLMQLHTERYAHFSPCRRYRYWLKILWSDDPLLVVIGLNPSTADEYVDDPTLRRVQRFARDMGKGGVIMLNAFAWRATDPKDMIGKPDPIGPENTIDNLIDWIGPNGPAVAAWGCTVKKKARLWKRHLDLSKGLRLDCFRRTQGGMPEHPLYLPASLRPVPWNYSTESTIRAAVGMVEHGT